MPLLKVNKLLLVFPVWIICSYLIESFTYFFSAYRLLNLLENFLFVALVFYLVNFFKSNKSRRVYLFIAVIAIIVMLWFETIMYYHFKISFGSSSFYIVMDTNPDEIGEFFKLFIDAQTIVITAFYCIPVFWLKRIVSYLNNITKKVKIISHSKIAIVLIAIASLIFFRLTKLIDQNLYYLVVRSSIIYYKDLSTIRDYERQFNNEKITVANANANTSNTFVIVVGESTARHHMSLYNYFRETTPKLKEIQEEIKVYNNVISPSTSTAKSLSKSLTLGNYEFPEKQLAMPITKLFSKAGFKTFWISNHSPVFNPNSLLTRITNQAEVVYHNSKEVVKKNVKHDGELMPHFEKALNDKAENKVIFLHLIGTHFDYENRYPERFNYFTDKPNSAFNSQEVNTIINQYDNAVRYNDFILSQVIEKTKATISNGYVMYFSDHGEEVFQDNNFFGHYEEKPTKNTFEIPFFMWYSEHFIYPEDYDFNNNIAYMIDDLWHSIVHISGIETELSEKERSMFSKGFKPRKRLILENKDFDVLFNE